MVGTRDEQWSEWIWCINSSGLGGWLPAMCLSSQQMGETATLLTRFDTVELTVGEGEELEGIEERGEWIWCRNNIGTEGWVPSDRLQRV